MPIQSVPIAFSILAVLAASAAAEPLKIIALGDSLTAGFGLEKADSFPAQLEAALRDRGYDVTIVNAGVSGDTASDGLARLDWSLDGEVDAAIVELGANDALRGVDPAVTREALDALLARLRERDVPVLLTGMVAPPNMGRQYGAAFNPIYAELAAEHDALLYPFFLAGVAAKPELNQPDGLHPTADGVSVIVDRILPSVETLIDRASGKREQSARSRSWRRTTVLTNRDKGAPPCRVCSPVSKSPPESASGWRTFAAACRAPAGSTLKTTISRCASSATSTAMLPTRSPIPSTG